MFFAHRAYRAKTAGVRAYNPRHEGPIFPRSQVVSSRLLLYPPPPPMFPNPNDLKTCSLATWRIAR